MVIFDNVVHGMLDIDGLLSNTVVYTYATKKVQRQTSEREREEGRAKKAKERRITE